MHEPRKHEGMGERPARGQAAEGEFREWKGFPENAIVGAVDDPDAVEGVLRDLEAAGFDDSGVRVFGGESGVQRIDPTGERHGFGGQLTRSLQALMGIEQEHTRRHVEELDAGHFLVGVTSDDEATTARVRDILAAHGGHFINYYSRWTARTLIP